MDETDTRLASRRRRLRYRAWRRGTREMDLILGSFADARLESMDGAALDRFAALLEQPDPELYDWIAQDAAPPAQVDGRLVRAVRDFHARRR